MFSFLNKKTQKQAIGVELSKAGVSIAMPKGSVIDNSLTITHTAFEYCDISAQAETLSNLVTSLNISGAAVNLVLSPDQYQSYNVGTPQVDASEVSDAIKWRVKDMLEFDLDAAVIDGFPIPTDALRGRPAQTNVVVAKKELIKRNVELIRSAGLELQSIDSFDLCLRNICTALGKDPERAIALLYLRDGTGAMVLVKGDDLYLARHFDFSVSALNDSTLQDQVIQNLGLQVQRSFDYFESQMGQIPPQELLLFGPDPSLPLANMVGGSIAARVLALSPNDSFRDALDEETDSGLVEVNTFVAQGAALRGVTNSAAD